MSALQGQAEPVAIYRCKAPTRIYLVRPLHCYLYSSSVLHVTNEVIPGGRQDAQLTPPKTLSPARDTAVAVLSPAATYSQVSAVVQIFCTLSYPPCCRSLVAVYRWSYGAMLLTPDLAAIDLRLRG